MFFPLGYIGDRSLKFNVLYGRNIKLLVLEPQRLIFCWLVAILLIKRPENMKHAFLLSMTHKYSNTEVNHNI